MPAQQFFIHCGPDFSLEQEGIAEIAVFPHLQDAIDKAQALQNGGDARLKVFNSQGAVISDTVFPSVK